MAFSKEPPMAGFKPKNKLRRQSAYLAVKKSKEAAKRDERFKRKREEAKSPGLREERQRRNLPTTIESKRKFDNDTVGDEEDALNWAIDVERLAKKRKLEQEAVEREENGGEDGEEGLLEKLKKRDAEDGEEEEDDEADSMLESDSEVEDDASDSDVAPESKRKPERAASPAMSTTTNATNATNATNLDISPDFLKQKFPAVFDPAETPKILVTTSINSTLHKEAEILASFFPNANYVRRSAHAHAHKYSVREIANFASNRDYTALVIMFVIPPFQPSPSQLTASNRMEAHHVKEPDGLDIVLLPAGPHFHFSISNWVEGKKLPGHGKDQGFYPELVLNGFRTPLGLLTAHLWRGLFPAQPELQGRTAVTLHNQRDYIFLRRHRYVFREKRATEKQVLDANGKPLKGVEDIRVGMQEIGPRAT
ncbi:Ribosome production factor 1 [Didymosphaeria variabile]|uniref:Ribosome production factor 1 n=1 Tax=Didymosphaeria variabile TaxID=1932322 RepID=A0A9W8XLZ2_9PLEO|nr:Ribosome production factor 1 [Didymosphaeria variabile]KAJ4354041.1 Ribosome production factor 1 [Didymosphaeria variabile]